MIAQQTSHAYAWMNDISCQFLLRGYVAGARQKADLIKRYEEIAMSAARRDGFLMPFLDYMRRGFYSFSSPVISNFGKENGGLPISCYGSYIPDSVDGIMSKVKEVGMMSKVGGGTSGYFGALRERGSITSGGAETYGPPHFMELYDATAQIISQGGVRRGSFAAYLDADHPDAMEFLTIREPHSPIQSSQFHFGLSISDEFMDGMMNADRERAKVWCKAFERRYDNGEPYLFFKGNANKNAPQWYQDQGYEIHASNLCTEIFLPSSEDESFVCCLSSMNLARYDEWKDTNAVELLLEFLDSVMEEYIQKVEGMPGMETAYKFAKNHRALGLGGLGWHTLLKQKRLPFGSLEAQQLNYEIWKTIRERCDEHTRTMAKWWGEAPVCEGYGVRNSTLLAIAPNASSSVICDQTSPGIEPLTANALVVDKAKLKYNWRCPILTEDLEECGKNNERTWMAIMEKGGSVQHLDFLSNEAKEIHLTFDEIPQSQVVTQAAIRQPFIDQGQSVNLFLDPIGTLPHEASDLALQAYHAGLKSLYYQRGSNPSHKVAQDHQACVACDG